MTVSLENQTMIVLSWKTNVGLVSGPERAPRLFGVDLLALKASGVTQRSGATLTQTAVWERAGERLVGVALLRSTSSVALSLVTELCRSPAPA